MSAGGTESPVRVPLSQAIDILAARHGYVELSGRVAKKQRIRNACSKGNLDEFIQWIKDKADAMPTVLIIDRVDYHSKAFYNNCCACASGRCRRCVAPDCRERREKSTVTLQGRVLNED